MSRKNEVLVYKSNELIEARYTLSAVAQKLAASTISKVHPKSTEPLIPFQYTIAEMADISGVSEQVLRNKLSVYTKELKGIIIEIRDPKSPGSYRQLSLYREFQYDNKEGLLRVHFEERLEPHIRDFAGNFTKYQLRQIQQLPSGHSIRIYEILRMAYNKSRGQAPYQSTVSEIKAMLGIKQDTYALFSNFRKKVLEVAKRDLEEQTDLKFEYETIRSGRKIASIRFFIEKNPKFEAVEESNEPKEGEHIPSEISPLSPEMSTSIRMFVSDKIADKQILQLGMYEDVVLRGALTAFMKADRPRNPIALFLHIVKATDQEYQSVVAKTGRSDDYDPWDTSWADQYDFGIWDD